MGQVKKNFKVVRRSGHLVLLKRNVGLFGVQWDDVFHIEEDGQVNDLAMVATLLNSIDNGQVVESDRRWYKSVKDFKYINQFSE